MGSLASRILAGPCAVAGYMVAGFVALTAICGCWRCMRCKIRDCACCKRFLRATGSDGFDDFDLMMVVHQVAFDCSKEKFATIVRVTAGSHCVHTDTNSNGIFQQPLHVTVEQGTDMITVDLLDSYKRVLATMALDVMEDVLAPNSHHSEHTYIMKQKVKKVLNPRIKLTLSVQHEADVEKALLTGVSTDVDDLVRLQLAKARETGAKGDLTELQVLKQACTGPLELFEGLGKTQKVYVAISGPPTSKRWVLCIWHDEHQFKSAKTRPLSEVDMLRIQSVQACPTRHHVFMINYYDEDRMRKSLTFRRMDRSRDVWVEILQQTVQKIHEARRKSPKPAPNLAKAIAGSSYA